jgi:hypothetical protein
MHRGLGYAAHNRNTAARPGHRPSSLYGANVRRWWQRLIPASGHDAWRGHTPLRAGQPRFLGPSALRPTL